MRIFAIIGYPLSHSFSQKYFTEKFARENIADSVFEIYPIPEISLLSEILETRKELSGFCITIPYKKAILSFLDQQSDAVRQMGACNCVKIQGNTLLGFNTDVIGFEKSFAPQLQPYHTKALILGTGGAAAAVEFVLQKLQISYRVVSRQKTKAHLLTYQDLDGSIIDEYTVIINCTPLGTYPDTEQAPELQYHLLTAKHYLFDLVYNPPLTKFLQLGAFQGATVKNGYDMLVIQAEENWNIWNS